jgi:hypothetical protein
MVKLKPQTHAKLQAMAREDDRTMGEIVSFLVDRYQRERYWQRVQDDYRKLHDDPDTLREYRNEMALWDSTAADGLADEAPYYSEEEVREILAEAAARSQGR